MPRQHQCWGLQAAVMACQAQEQQIRRNEISDDFTDAIESTPQNHVDKIENPSHNVDQWVIISFKSTMVSKLRWTYDHWVIFVFCFFSIVFGSDAWVVTTINESSSRLHFTTRISLPTDSMQKRMTTSLFVAAPPQGTPPQPPRRRFSQGRTDDSSNKKYGSDSKLMSLHTERIQTAGRRGTKRFIDPCKVFVGNLPFDVDSDQLAAFILNTMGQSRMNLHASKVIHDWKTGKSKGYGFVEFTDPIFATVCMEICHGKTLQGRSITVSQGKKKEQEQQLYIKKKRKDPESDEEGAISAGVEEAETDKDDDEVYSVEELDVDEDGIAVFGNNDHDDLELDATLFGISAVDDEDEGVDGIFLERKPIYEEMDPNLNREQRRDVAKRLKRKKLPHKGFG